VRKTRVGFTLVELLIVVVIMLILATLTMSAVKLSVNNDKVRGAARQLQSALAGARDRAIYARAPRGLRFLLDSSTVGQTSRTVSSMIYIQQTPAWTQGQIRLERIDVDNNGISDEWVGGVANPLAWIVRGFDGDPANPDAIPTAWVDLMNEGLLTNGAKIKIPNDPTGLWYTVTVDLLANATAAGVTPTYPPRLRLTTAYPNPPTNNNPQEINAFMNGGPMTYQLILPNSVLPGSDMIQLPKGSVIHLDRSSGVIGSPGTASYVNTIEQVNAATLASNRGSKLPSSWKIFSPLSTDPSGFDYSTQMDILFSPSGAIMGPAAQKGLIEFYIADQKDADRDRQYWSNPSSYPTSSCPEYGVWSDPSANGYERGDKAILALFTRTGAVSTHSVNPDSIRGGVTYQDPFKYAETGEVAGK
jgi:prepilin-type N-terminal cleavage/methylation domain-containing protein